MKKLFKTLCLFLTICTMGYSQTKNFIDQPYIETVGYGDSLVTPNQIFIKIVISERDSRDRVPVEDIESRMVDSLKAIGISTEKYLTTNDIGSNFRFYFLKRKDILKMKNYILEVPDAITATKVFMLLEDLEISNTSIDRVDHTEIKNIKHATRIKAVLDAKTKAIQLTNSLGQTIGPAIYVSDIEGTSNFDNRQNGLQEVVVMGFSSKKLEKPLPKIEFKKIKISSTVNVKFILK